MRPLHTDHIIHQVITYVKHFDKFIMVNHTASFIRIRLSDAYVDRTEVHQIKSTTSEFDFRRVLMIQIPVGEKRKEAGQK
ncbi:TPA: hypothetical protein ACHV9L_002077, partial [Streptococcus suis]